MPSIQSTSLCIYVIVLIAVPTAVTAFMTSPMKHVIHDILPSHLRPSKLYSECDSGCTKEDSNKDKPLIEPLQPFIPAMDPNYINTGAVGEKDFVVSRTGPPIKEELSNENLYKILMLQCSDLEVNTLVWKCLGYRFIEKEGGGGEWSSENVFPKWQEKYPTPPDLIGMKRIYSKEVDQVSLKANQSLVRSVPVDNKQSLKTHLRPLGFTGYKVRIL